jgi:hypothetical protein
VGKKRERQKEGRKPDKLKQDRPYSYKVIFIVSRLSLEPENISIEESVFTAI